MKRNIHGDISVRRCTWRLTELTGRSIRQGQGERDYLDLDDRAGEGGEAHLGDGEGTRRMEGPSVAGEHADLERLLEHFGAGLEGTG